MENTGVLVSDSLCLLFGLARYSLVLLCANERASSGAADAMLCFRCILGVAGEWEVAWVKRGVYRDC